MSKAGQPLKFKSVEELQEKIDLYFDKCDKEEIPYTVTGLALDLDTNRQTLINYEKKEEYFDTIKKAKARVENWLEIKLLKDQNVTGKIFSLKNNFGWKDEKKVEQEHSGEIGIIIKDLTDEDINDYSNDLDA